MMGWGSRGCAVGCALPLSSILTYILKKGRGLGDAPTVTPLISCFDHEKSFDLPRPGGVCVYFLLLLQ